MRVLMSSACAPMVARIVVAFIFVFLPWLIRWLLHLHDVVGLPGLVEERLRGGVEADARHVAFTGNGLDPVGVGSLRRGRTEIDVRRSVGVWLEVAVGGDGRKWLAVVQQ